MKIKIELDTSKTWDMLTREGGAIPVEIEVADFVDEEGKTCVLPVDCAFGYRKLGRRRRQTGYISIENLHKLISENVICEPIYESQG